eukprot:g37220.t1
MAAKTGGCFPGNASVLVEDGRRKRVSDLQPGDRVQTVDHGGNVIFSSFVTFLDRDPRAMKIFQLLETQDPPHSLLLTPAHLVYVADNFTLDLGKFRPTFASNVQVGQYLYVVGHSGHRPAMVIGISMRELEGAYAPLTQHGTLVVNGILASCFAAIDGHRLAHLAFAPLRLCYQLTSIFGGGTSWQEGMHWYSRLLYRLGRLFLSAEYFHPWG